MYCYLEPIRGDYQVRHKDYPRNKSPTKNMDPARALGYY